jgi:threonyl-tRNA synthetase
LPLWTPKGTILRSLLEDFLKQEQLKRGYLPVVTPHLARVDLFKISGHWQNYKDDMFPMMAEDAESAALESGFALKPMNCPFHILIFKSQGRSYRDLPMRLFEFGSVYRYEKSGTLHGLTRVRGMTQDDAHLFVTPENMEQELTNVLNFVLGLLRDYGLDDFYLELSTKEAGNPKFVGDDDIWTTATETLERVALQSGLELLPDPGGAAFYGPKISVQARDAIGRTWQMSTIQLDFNLPQRFDLEYTAADGSRQRPIMIHRALFGSIERFFGVLTEHYAGHFPPWLAPVQVVGIPVANEFSDYLDVIAAELRAKGVRIEVDRSDDRMQKKILNHTKAKIPFLLIAGGQDRDSGAVSFRFRDGTQENGIPVADAVARILNAIQAKTQV